MTHQKDCRKLDLRNSLNRKDDIKMKDGKRILVMMNILLEEIPLSMEYETDARDVWPKRWKRLRDFVNSLDIKEEK